MHAKLVREITFKAFAKCVNIAMLSKQLASIKNKIKMRMRINLKESRAMKQSKIAKEKRKKNP